VAALRAMHYIEKIELQSLESAMTLFRVKLVPILTYCIQVVWDHLTETDLKTLEKLKAVHLKKLLCVPKTGIYTDEEIFLIQDFRMQLLLSSTPAVARTAEMREKKKNNIWTDFCSTDAMTNPKWMKANYQPRRVDVSGDASFSS
jgi:hypothetical protein